MQAIWKFPMVIGDNHITMPAHSQVLCVQAQYDRPVLWALVFDTDDTAPKTIRTFHTYGTGHKRESIEGRYIGTYQLEGGALVFHVFEELK